MEVFGFIVILGYLPFTFSEKTSHRDKRYVYWPTGGTYKICWPNTNLDLLARLAGCKENLLIDRWITQDSVQYKRNLSMAWIDYSKMVIGIGTPLKLGSKQSMAIGWNFQMQYMVPTNLTVLKTYPPDYTGRRKRDILESDRTMIYRGVEDVLNGAGIDGKACIYRSICENALDSMNHDANGLYGLLFHIVFTPSYGDGEIDPDLDPTYLDAERAGEYGVDCSTLYSNCNWGDGLLGLFTILDSEYG